MLVRERHPHADRPLIDYFVASVLEPSTLLGTVAGVLLNRIFPNWLITILLVLLLGLTSVRTLQKVREPPNCQREKAIGNEREGGGTERVCLCVCLAHMHATRWCVPV